MRRIHIHITTLSCKHSYRTVKKYLLTHWFLVFGPVKSASPCWLVPAKSEKKQNNTINPNAIDKLHKDVNVFMLQVQNKKAHLSVSKSWKHNFLTCLKSIKKVVVCVFVCGAQVAAGRVLAHASRSCQRHMLKHRHSVKVALSVMSNTSPHRQ